jgi:hypothetical protein
MKIVIFITMSVCCSMQLFAQQSTVSDTAKSAAPKISFTKNTSPDYLKVTPIQNNYYNQLGVACKLELNFEKSTKVPLRLRLGSLQQTDYMEQKPNAIKPSK